jgi:large subunit ribosomal protein L9
MKIILKKDVESLGRRGDIVEVAAGYGRNYLIPQKIALEVTSSNMKMIEIERQALVKNLEKERLTFQDLIQNLSQTTLTFKRKAGEKDVIFGSVSSSDIKEALKEAGFEIDKKKILLEEPIKRLGNHTVPIKVFHDDRAEIKVEIVKEGEEEAKEEREKGKILEEKKEEALEIEEKEEGMEAEEKEEELIKEGLEEKPIEVGEEQKEEVIEEGEKKDKPEETGEDIGTEEQESKKEELKKKEEKQEEKKEDEGAVPEEELEDKEEGKAEPDKEEKT